MSKQWRPVAIVGVVLVALLIVYRLVTVRSLKTTPVNGVVTVPFNGGTPLSNNDTGANVYVSQKHTLTIQGDAGTPSSGVTYYVSFAIGGAPASICNSTDHLQNVPPPVVCHVLPNAPAPGPYTTAVTVVPNGGHPHAPQVFKTYIRPCGTGCP